MSDDPLRAHLIAYLDWEDAHAGFEAAVADLPEKLRGQRPAGLPYSPWELVEHMRLAQHDILDFCRNPHYAKRAWPVDYWPPTTAPPSAEAWDRSLREYLGDRASLQQLAGNREIDLYARIPHGTGQTYLRELLLVVDHAAYHVGQLVAVRRLLGAWSGR